MFTHNIEKIPLYINLKSMWFPQEMRVVKITIYLPLNDQLELKAGEIALLEFGIHVKSNLEKKFQKIVIKYSNLEKILFCMLEPREMILEYLMMETLITKEEKTLIANKLDGYFNKKSLILSSDLDKIAEIGSFIIKANKPHPLFKEMYVFNKINIEGYINVLNQFLKMENNVFFDMLIKDMIIELNTYNDYQLKINSLLKDLLVMFEKNSNTAAFITSLLNINASIQTEIPSEAAFNNYRLLKTLYQSIIYLGKTSLHTPQNILLLLKTFEETQNLNKLMYIPLDLKRLIKLGLFNETNFKIMVNMNPLVEKSCSARIKTNTLGGNMHDKSIFWSYCSVGAENILVDMFQRQESLLAIFNKAREIRFAIAKLLNQQDAELFGKPRDRGCTDIFSQSDKSVSHKDIFPEIKQLVSSTLNITAADLKYNQFFPPIVELTLSSLGQVALKLPQRKLILTYDLLDNGSLELCSIINNFPNYLTQENFEKGIGFLDDRLKIIHNNYNFYNKDDDKNYLFAIGSLFFYFMRFYYLQRGTSAILQWIIKAEILNYSEGKITLTDLRLGNNVEDSKNIPYDIYALLVDDPDIYAKAFFQAIYPQFNKITRDISMCENLEEPAIIIL